MKRCLVSFVGEESEECILQVDCEIASSYSQKAKGLMNKASLKPDEGMLFRFVFPFFRLFWMYRVVVPLDIVFIRGGRVRKVVEAEVKHGLWSLVWCCGSWTDMVVELNMGVCEKNGVESGCGVKVRKR